MKKKLDLLSSLLREFENDIGTSDLLRVVLEALKKSMKDFRPQSHTDFRNQFENLVYLFCHTEPKFGLFRYYFQKLIYEFDHLPDGFQDFDTFFENQIEHIQKKEAENNLAILHHSEEIDVHNKSILIYDQSHTVRNVLSHLQAQKKKFNVIVAEQEPEKTHSNIEFLHQANIPFQVVPDYMLSHIGDRVDMLFFGALTLKSNMDFVMSTGTHSVISEFHTMKTPLYMFIQTTKLSLWESDHKEVYHREESRCHSCKPINYTRLKFSHDRVEAGLFDKIITNEGIFSEKTLKEFFDLNLTDYKKQSKALSFDIEHTEFPHNS